MSANPAEVTEEITKAFMTTVRNMLDLRRADDLPSTAWANHPERRPLTEQFVADSCDKLKSACEASGGRFFGNAPTCRGNG